MKELEVIYEEFPMDLSFKEWMHLYNLATDGPHDFLFIDMYGPEKYRMRKGFSKALVYTET